MPKFQKTYCSHCGREFGPGDHGFSHCDQHPGLQREIAQVRHQYGNYSLSLHNAVFKLRELGLSHDEAEEALIG